MGRSEFIQSHRNYIDIRNLYENRYAEDVLSVQKAKVRALKDFKIKRVFISLTEDELKTPAGKNLIKEHIDERAPMDIKSVLYQGIDQTELERIGGKKNLDFAIFDCRVVLIWHLDARREIVGFNVLVGQEVAKDFESFFDHLFTAGVELPKLN